MPKEKPGVSGKSVDLSFSPLANCKPSKQSDKKANISFLLGPKTKQKSIRKKVEKDDGYLAGHLKWAKLINDREVFKSADRAKLEEHLEDLLEGLNLRYIKGTAGKFPSSGELTKLTEVILAFGQALGVKKLGFGDLLGVMKRIENRHSKMQLIGFADNLLNRLLALPKCPLSVVHQASKIEAKNRETLEEIKNYLSGEKADDTTIPWIKWFEGIQLLEFPTSTLLTPTVPNPLRTEFVNGTVARKQILARMVFTDLKRQQYEWGNEYGKKTKASLKWIYLLQRREDYQRLTQIYCGTAPSPEDAAGAMVRFGNNQRRSRSYRKHKAKNDVKKK